MPLWTAQDRVTDTVNKVLVATLGSGDFCLIASVPFPLDQVPARLRAVKIAIQAGPVSRRAPLDKCAPFNSATPTATLLK